LQENYTIETSNKGYLSFCEIIFLKSLLLVRKNFAYIYINASLYCHIKAWQKKSFCITKQKPSHRLVLPELFPMSRFYDKRIIINLNQKNKTKQHSVFLMTFTIYRYHTEFSLG
jgi:hypothetical protein